MEPKKFRNSSGMHSGSAGTVVARCSTHHRHNPRFAARKPKKPGVSGVASSPLHFSVSGEDLCHLQKEKTHTSQLILFLHFYRYAFGSLFLLLHR